jgi:hypothetical protein
MTTMHNSTLAADGVLLENSSATSILHCSSTSQVHRGESAVTLLMHAVRARANFHGRC